MYAMINDRKNGLNNFSLSNVRTIVMPILTFSFGLQYMDKAVLNSASVFGIIKDLVRPGL
jgi:hypothetical protein